jgi:hypothetical protein
MRSTLSSVTTSAERRSICDSRSSLAALKSSNSRMTSSWVTAPAPAMPALISGAWE